jgi:hypothetical protein
VTADDNINPPAFALSVEGGIGVALSGAVAVTTVSGVTSATSRAHGPAGSGGEFVSATGNHGNVTATTKLAAIGAGLSAGVSFAYASDGRSTEARVTGGGLDTSGQVQVLSYATNVATATAPAVTGGAGAIAVMIPTALVSGDTVAELDGNVGGTSSASSVTVQADGQNRADAEAKIGSLGIVGLSGAFAHAEILSSANVDAGIGSGAQITTSGAVLVDAEGASNPSLGSWFSGTAYTAGQVVTDTDGNQYWATTNIVNTTTHPQSDLSEWSRTGNQVVAHADAVSIGAVTVGVMIATAYDRGAVRAHQDGDITSSNQVTVKALNVNYAEAFTTLISASLFGGSGALDDAEVTTRPRPLAP